MIDYKYSPEQIEATKQIIVSNSRIITKSRRKGLANYKNADNAKSWKPTLYALQSKSDKLLQFSIGLERTLYDITDNVLRVRRRRSDAKNVWKHVTKADVRARANALLSIALDDLKLKRINYTKSIKTNCYYNYVHGLKTMYDVNIETEFVKQYFKYQTLINNESEGQKETFSDYIFAIKNSSNAENKRTYSVLTQLSGKQRVNLLKWLSNCDIVEVDLTNAVPQYIAQKCNCTTILDLISKNSLIRGCGEKRTDNKITFLTSVFKQLSSKCSDKQQDAALKYIITQLVINDVPDTEIEAYCTTLRNSTANELFDLEQHLTRFAESHNRQNIIQVHDALYFVKNDARIKDLTDMLSVLGIAHSINNHNITNSEYIIDHIFNNLAS